MGHLQDHMHEYYHRQIEDGLLDQQVRVWEWQEAFYQADVQALASLGWTYILSEKATLPAASSVSTGFVSHATLPTATFSSLITVVGARDLLVETFLGGTVSGGVTMVQFPTNLDNPQEPPNQFAAAGVTIDVAGVLIFTDEILGAGGGTDDALQGGGIIIPANTTSYKTYTNNDAQSVDLEISYLMAALPGVPS